MTNETEFVSLLKPGRDLFDGSGFEIGRQGSLPSPGRYESVLGYRAWVGQLARDGFGASQLETNYFLRGVWVCPSATWLHPPGPRLFYGYKDDEYTGNVRRRKLKSHGVFQNGVSSLHSTSIV